MMTRVKRRALRYTTAAALAVVGLGLLGAERVEAQPAFGVNGNFGTETDFGIGGRIHLGLSQAVQGLEGMGSFELFFPDGPVSYWEINANVFYRVPVQGQVLPYVGGGLNIGHTDVGDIDSTDIGLNLGGGVRFLSTSVTPFVEGRAVISSNDQFVITAGLLFGNATP